MGEGLNKPLFSQRCLQMLLFFFLARFARELADVFEKNEKKNKMSVYRLMARSFGRIWIRITDLSVHLSTFISADIYFRELETWTSRAQHIYIPRCFKR